MLGLLLIYFIGKYWYQLAERFNKNAWGHGILGVVTYYAGTFLGGIGIAIFMEMFSSRGIEEMNDFALGIMALPIGLLCTWGLYKILEKRYTGALEPGISDYDSDILDDGIL